jgi:putative phosphonate metabolism protein
MDGFERYAIYWAPRPGAFAETAAAWLGWDAASACARPHPAWPGLPRPVAELTDTPRKYGFHGTIKPPFRLAAGTRADDLHEAAGQLCGALAPVALPGLALHRIGGFVALTPQGDERPLADLAAAIVAGLDRFRAPPDQAEIARRRPERLTPRQRIYLERWGYPYVMEEFRFHLTLTGDLEADEARDVAAVLGPRFAPLLPAPFVLDSLCLFGQATGGMFRILHRYELSS